MEDFVVPLGTHCVYYDENFLSEKESGEVYEELLKITEWQKTDKINRWVALHEELGTQDGYRYRDSPASEEEETKSFNEPIRAIKQKAEEWYNQKNNTNIEFNVCLLNFYEDGTQRIGWHSDREEIGRRTPIASVSLGASRLFQVRSKENGHRDRAEISLKSGSIVVMENVCQQLYVHSIPKQAEVTGGRINLTFRCKGDEQNTAGEEMHARRDKWLERITSDFSGGMSENATEDSKVFGDGIKTIDVDAGATVLYTAQTNIGAERYAAAEIAEVLDDEAWDIVSRPWGVAGYVSCSRKDGWIKDQNGGESQKVASALLGLRSAHHVMVYHDHFGLNTVANEEMPTPARIDGEALYSFYKNRLLDGGASISCLVSEEGRQGGMPSFRVTCKRIGGPHGFGSVEVEREVGGAIAEVYTHCVPKMRSYDVNIRVDVVGNEVIVGTQLNVDDLSKRHFVRFRNGVSIKCNLAYAMARCAAIKKGDLVVDPFCGSGTILLEALEMTGKQIRCIGMDVSKKSIKGAQENSLAEGNSIEMCGFHCTDARGLRKHLENESVDAIVTNLPWGVMTGSKNFSDLHTMYEVFLRCAWYVLKDGARIVMLVLRGLQLTRILRKLSGRYRLLSVNVVRTSNNLPCIVVVEKVGKDALHDSIKGQLHYMSQFVSVSPEMYNAIHMQITDDHPPSIK